MPECFRVAKVRFELYAIEAIVAIDAVVTIETIEAIAAIEKSSDCFCSQLFPNHVILTGLSFRVI